ncbi:MAG TPA: shikimate kinase [Dehalococcoidales bacterium]|nr:shikimate kinase [Dehalococcoidales bacterium]
MARESIILIGMPASGKSTIGKILSAELGYDFVDLDVYIQEKAQQPLQEIIDSLGEAALMQLEKKRMEEISLPGKVIAPGGSLVFHTELMEQLRRQAVIVYLNESLSSLETRLKNAATRGIIGLKGKSLAEIYAERTPLYNRYADIIIDSTRLTRRQIVAEIKQQFHRLS